MGGAGRHSRPEPERSDGCWPIIAGWRFLTVAVAAVLAGIFELAGAGSSANPLVVAGALAVGAVFGLIWYVLFWRS